ncbi:dTDP-4-amino-4,6-dideoxygalactose transaminase [Oceanobacillus limi]|uniref:dTDP-4-amino-4,6-dideoxygalactose transaminase n=1 Tax=Oceanobacillus limi TaxID=930131 RepID=A0A1I0H0T8_9BACI|nr:DegT/DnrJ/EryC1/StrS family aminotransferase [Oceanobacillus limi]SET77114.1 dTDP-4-amino-4,6-dideoxygalactose transaminase [Oceanobacillus limi]
MIPLIDSKKQFQSIQDNIVEVISEVVESGQYILGTKVNELEKQIAEHLDVKYAIAVGNGTDALVLTLDAYNVGKGDEVITTPFSFFATAEAITRVGATPVFVDIDPDTFHISPHQLKEKISPRTKAILPVHIFGQSANMDEIQAVAKEYHLLVIEDACQAFGATYKQKAVGSIGDAACFSFFPTKNLGTLGDGGMITTADEQVANRIRRLRVHGSNQKYYHQEIGYNSRLDEIHAAILLECLKQIDYWNERRASIAEYYMNELQDVPELVLPAMLPDRNHVFHLFCLRSTSRQKIIEFLGHYGIQTGIYYPRCLHLQEAYQNLGYRSGDFPIAEKVSDEIFAIPMHPFLEVENQDQVIEMLKIASEKN